MAETTYIYDKKEYKKTGRVAIKKKKRGGTREITEELIELRPSNVTDDNNDYNVWVKIEDLYEVSEN
jgi:hypothetical protein